MMTSFFIYVHTSILTKNECVEEGHITLHRRVIKVTLKVICSLNK